MVSRAHTEKSREKDVSVTAGKKPRARVVGQRLRTFCIHGFVQALEEDRRFFGVFANKLVSHVVLTFQDARSPRLLLRGRPQLRNLIVR